VQFSELKKDRDLDLGSGHTAYRHASSSTSMYIPDFTEIGQTFCGQTYGWAYLLTDGHFPL